MRLKAALPSVLTALKVAAPTAIVGAIVGEELGGTSNVGLGYAMIASEQMLDVPRTWAIALVAALVGGVGYIAIGIIARFAGFSIFRFLGYIKDELLIVLGTSSSESALPSLMEKLERLGCSKSVVGLVVPTGYSFNLDGTNIYMTLATLFVAEKPVGRV